MCLWQQSMQAKAIIAYLLYYFQVTIPLFLTLVCTGVSEQISPQMGWASIAIIKMVIFCFGISNTGIKSWSKSENQFRSLCQNQLQLSLEEKNIKHAPRLKKFEVRKNRPIITKLSSYKDKEKFLSLGPKLIITNVAIREDFSVPVRQAQSKPIRLTKEHGSPFTLWFWFMDGICYYYDVTPNRVKIQYQ